MQRFLIRLFIFIAVVAGAVALSAGHQTVRADGPPNQKIARWDDFCINGFQQQGGVTAISYTYTTEDIVRQTLAGEMGQQDFWHPEALKANATIIRQDSLYYRNHMEYPGFLTPDWFCEGVTPYAFDWRDSIMEFSHGDLRPDQDAAVYATWGIGWFKPGVPQTDFTFQPWGNEMQLCTEDMAQVGWGHQAIVGSGNWPPGVFSSSTPCPTEPVAPAYVFCHWDSKGHIDHDCDGYSTVDESSIGTDNLGRCNEGFDSGPSPSWPSDFTSGGIPNSTDKIVITDLTSFLAPTRRLGTSPGNPAFSPRWDLVPGLGLFGSWIAVNDLTALFAGSSGFPPMFGGQKAFGGLACTNHPVYGY